MEGSSGRKQWKETQCFVVMLSDGPLPIVGPVVQLLEHCFAGFDSPLGDLLSSIMQNLKPYDVYKLVWCVPSVRTLRLGCSCKFQNGIFEKNRVARGSHQRLGIDYDKPTSSFVCLESLRTLLALPSMMRKSAAVGSHQQQSQEVH